MLRRYDLPSDKTCEGWAKVVIDTDCGFFATVSDFGNYAYLWTHPGCEFRKFLIGLEPDYLHSKLMHGRPDSEVFDGQGTHAFVKESLEELKDSEPALYETEKELLEDWSTFETLCDFEDWQRRTERGDAWEYHKTFPEPQCRAFCEKVMPRFKALLTAELEQETRDTILAADIRAAAPAFVAEVRAGLKSEAELALNKICRGCRWEDIGTMQREFIRVRTCPLHGDAVVGAYEYYNKDNR